jgi:putative Holliday junction resolvase
MRIMALDIGHVRCGIAISDPGERVASPLCVLPTREILGMAPSFRRLIEDWEPDTILSGLPYTMRGQEGPQAGRIREMAQTIAERCNLPLEFADERLSSSEAKRSLREKGLSERDMRGKVDMIAASLFLQSWLDARQTSRQDRED